MYITGEICWNEVPGHLLAFILFINLCSPTFGGCVGVDLEARGEGVEIGMASVVLARSATCLFSQCLLLELIVAYLHCCLVPPHLYQSSV